MNLDLPASAGTLGNLELRRPRPQFAQQYARDLS
jgi:hypothetical protein